MNERIYEIMNILSDILPENRFIHSTGVMYSAIFLAVKHDESIEKAAFAGLLHDCAKYMTSDELYNYCINNNISLDESEIRSHQLIHCKVGEIFAKKKYGINDMEILNAIRFHTTGRDNMSKLEQIVFIADYIEPNRKPVYRIDEIRKTAFEDLNKTCAMILQNTIGYLKNKTNNYIEKKTLDAFDFYKQYLD